MGLGWWSFDGLDEVKSQPGCTSLSRNYPYGMKKTTIIAQTSNSERHICCLGRCGVLSLMT